MSADAATMPKWEARQYRDTWAVGEESPIGWCTLAVGLNEKKTRLIAAAPDMYKALLDAMHALDGIRDGEFDPKGATVIHTLAVVQAAINKAEGRDASRRDQSADRQAIR